MTPVFSLWAKVPSYPGTPLQTLALGGALREFAEWCSPAHNSITGARLPRSPTRAHLLVCGIYKGGACRPDRDHFPETYYRMTCNGEWHVVVRQCRYRKFQEINKTFREQRHPRLAEIRYITKLRPVTRMFIRLIRKSRRRSLWFWTEKMAVHFVSWFRIDISVNSVAADPYFLCHELV